MTLTNRLNTHNNIAILWYGLEGRSTHNFLLKHGIDNEQITILDKNPACAVPASTRAILWDNYCDDIDQYDLVFKAPWITRALIEPILSVPFKKIPWSSQTQLFFERYEGPTIWVTWTKGKTTTVTILHEIFKHAWYHAVLWWNAWHPILDLIDFEHPPEIVIYELSSFMLDAIQQSNYTLDIGLFTSFFHTHEKEHGSIAAYKQAKRTIASHAKTLILWKQVVEAYGRQPDELPNNTVIFWKNTARDYDEQYIYQNQTQYIDHRAFRLPWVHNLYNLAAVCATVEQASTLGYTELKASLEHCVATFQWVEHRIEYVATKNWLHWYNDAIATTPEATCAAIEAFQENVWCLLYGWIEWPYDHGLIISLIETYSINVLVLFPDTGHHIRAAVGDNPAFHILETRSMDEAVAFANKHTPNNSIVLLSCGSPSFSCRSWFKEKWTLFKQAVYALPEEKSI